MGDSVFDTPPETLYKYTSFERAWNVLMTNRVYFARLAEFNDPFDGLLAMGTDTRERREKLAENIEKKFREMGEVFDVQAKQEFVRNQYKADKFAGFVMNGWRKEDRTGFYCLTDNPQSLPMWAHYADNHAGCRLTFDFSADANESVLEHRFPFHYMKKIEYCDKLPVYDMDRSWHDYSYKSREWAYEREWRAVMFRSKSNRSDTGAGDYPLYDRLQGVVLGYNMTDANKKDIVRAARQRGVAVFRAEPELYKYGMRITPIDGGRK